MIQTEKYKIVSISVPLTDELKAYACKNDITDDKSFKVGVIRFHPLQKIDKTDFICEFKMKRNRQR